MSYYFLQGDNLVRLEEKGIGVGINKWATTTEIVDAVIEVTNNTK